MINAWYAAANNTAEKLPPLFWYMVIPEAGTPNPSKIAYALAASPFRDCGSTGLPIFRAALVTAERAFAISNELAPGNDIGMDDQCLRRDEDATGFSVAGCSAGSTECALSRYRQP